MSHAYIATNAIDNAHDSDIFAVVTSDKYTITGSGDGTIKLWNNAEAEPTAEVLATGPGIHHLAVNAEGHVLAAVSFDGQLSLYDLEKKQKIDAPEIYEKTADSWDVSISHNDLLAVASVEGRVSVWDIKSQELVASFNSNKGIATCIDISNDGATVVCGYSQGGMSMYSIEKGGLDFSLPSYSGVIRSAKFSPQGQFLAAAGDSTDIAIYDTSSATLITNLSGHEGWIFSVDWNETGEYLLSTCYDGKCKVWSFETRTSVATQSESHLPLFCAKWLQKGWGVGVIGGVHQGFVTVGLERSVRWYRQAAGN
uniref:ARAD1C09636p n=1 Tax=Blastobotrys adeninivorans TaxID=409370 RepID=A0A060T5Z4_BLAAD